MSAIAAPAILCGGCNRRFAWKPQLAGKRVKCKCGHVIAVSGTAATRPAEPAPRPRPAVAPPKPATKPADDLDGLLALAADADRAAAAMPIEIREVAPVAVAVAAPAPAAGRNMLGYQRGPTAAERQKAAVARSALVDPVKDIYIPVTLLVAGLAMYVAFYGWRFHLGFTALSIVAVLLSVLTALKTALLVVAALLLAGPLGVGFGPLGQAVLKLAAIAVFTDGTTAWVDGGLGHVSGHHADGLLGYSMFGWGISVLMYWGLLAYLFALDLTEVRMFVLCLGIFSRVIRLAVILFLTNGVSGLAAPGTSAVSAAPAAKPVPFVRVSPLSDHVANLKAGDFLVEARSYIAQGNQSALTPTVDGWYAAGCPTVWFEMSARDINGRRSPQGLVVQLPNDLPGRRKAYQVLKAYDAQMQLSSLPSQMRDTGESYLIAGLR